MNNHFTYSLSLPRHCPAKVSLGYAAINNQKWPSGLLQMSSFCQYHKHIRGTVFFSVVTSGFLVINELLAVLDGERNLEHQICHV